MLFANSAIFVSGTYRVKAWAEEYEESITSQYSVIWNASVSEPNGSQTTAKNLTSHQLGWHLGKLSNNFSSIWKLLKDKNITWQLEGTNQSLPSMKRQ